MTNGFMVTSQKKNCPPMVHARPGERHHGPHRPSTGLSRTSYGTSFGGRPNVRVSKATMSWIHPHGQMTKGKSTRPIVSRHRRVTRSRRRHLNSAGFLRLCGHRPRARRRHDVWQRACSMHAHAAGGANGQFNVQGKEDEEYAEAMGHCSGHGRAGAGHGTGVGTDLQKPDGVDPWSRKHGYRHGREEDRVCDTEKPGSK